MLFINAVTGVLSVFLIGFLGYILTRKGWVAPQTAAVLPKFVTTIVLPPYLLRSVTGTFERDQLLQLLYGASIPLLSIVLTFLVGVALSMLLKIEKHRRGIFRTAFAASNTMNIGLPINIALFGEAALPYVLLYFFGNALFFWTVGCYSIAHGGDNASVKLFSRESLKQILSPPLVGFLCGLALVLLDLHLPVFIDKTFKYVGDMAIGLAVMYIGIIIHSIQLKDCTLDRDMLAVFTGRFLISPLTVLLLTWFIPVPTLMRNVFLIQSSLPVMLNVAIIAAYYNADTRYATVLTSISTLCAIVTVPFYMLLISVFSG